MLNRAPAGEDQRVVPSTALIIALDLPAPIEVLRKAGDLSAAAGCPAHVTLLYPFAAEGSITPSVVHRIATICAVHEPFQFELVAVRSWPDTVYLEPEPAAAFRPLQSDLASAFPEFPLYGVGLPFEPHVTVATVEDGSSLVDLETEVRTVSAPLLPLGRSAERVDLIAQNGAGAWTVLRVFSLGAG